MWMLSANPHSGIQTKACPNYPDPVTAAIDQERRELFERIGELYESCFVVTLTFLPPMLAQRKFVELMFDDDTENLNFKSAHQSLLQYLSANAPTFESRLSSTFELTRLKADNRSMKTARHDT